jgi:regulator of sigma E protease
MAFADSIVIALEVVLLFNLLIGVHELGHFLAAKWRGLKIDRFAIWFGKPVWKKKIGGVEYALGWIPAGGYVALPQMATMEAIEGKNETPAESLPQVAPLDKIIVAFAGPLFSFSLAVFFAFVVWGVGKPTTEEDNTTTIGWADPNGPAWRAGLRPGDKILSVDGYPVHHFLSTTEDSITWRIITSEKPVIPIQYVRDGVTATAYVAPTNLPTKWYERKSLRKILISPAYPAVIAGVISNSPAARAGLRTNDEVLAVDGRKIYSPAMILQMQEQFTNGPLRPVTFTVQRDRQEFTCTLRPERPIQPTNAPPLFGLLFWAGSTDETIVHPNPFEQIRDSASMIFATLGTVLSPKSDVGLQQLGGPVMIGRAYYNLLQDEQGWRRVLWFSVILNVNLALLNLLPLPVLDGGHILLSLIEAIRRRPVSARILSNIQTGFAALLIGFMLYIAFFDTSDWVRSARAGRETPVIFAPPEK